MLKHYSKKCPNNVATLCCTKNRRCESSCVTAPLSSHPLGKANWPLNAGWPFNRELKQQRWRRLRKRHFKSEVALFQTLLRLFCLIHADRQILTIFSAVEFWDCIKVQKKKKAVAVFTFFTKREIRHFHVVVVQWRQRNVQKNVTHAQSCCFAILSAFMSFSLTSPSSLLKLPNKGLTNLRVTSNHESIHHMTNLPLVKDKQ